MQEKIFVRNITKEEVLNRSEEIFNRFKKALEAIEEFSESKETANNNIKLLDEAVEFRENLLKRVDEYVLQMSQLPPRSPNTQTKC
ncbi:MAG: hypothetical protein SNF33_00885 [Candidatus Algichlamydia australiensis]|nr:hypothetical protein [Chlamydiales bacterium]